MAISKKEKRAILKNAENFKDGQYGIETLIKIQLWKAETIEEIIDIVNRAKKKKSVLFFAFSKLFNNVIDLGWIIGQNQKIAQEYQELSDEEQEKLNEVFKNAFNVDDSKAEEIAERTNAISHHLAQYIMFLSKTINKK